MKTTEENKTSILLTEDERNFLVWILYKIENAIGYCKIPQTVSQLHSIEEDLKTIIRLRKSIVTPDPYLYAFPETRTSSIVIKYIKGEELGNSERETSGK